MLYRYIFLYGFYLKKIRNYNNIIMLINPSYKKSAYLINIKRVYEKKYIRG